MADRWRHIAQSVLGQSHRSDGTPCQDHHRVQVLTALPEEALIACVADGAGSVPHSDVGSQIACETIVEQATEHLQSAGGEADCSRDDVVRWCDLALQRIEENAARRGAPASDLATTICAAIVTQAGSCFFQVGDGAIVVCHQGIVGVVFWPQSGEYVNTTTFLTSNNYHEQFQYFATRQRFLELALLTDGIERMALCFDGQTAHAPFFTPLFQAIRRCEETQQLSGELSRFLLSESVSTRSDDDKTLIVASQLRDAATDAA